MKNRKLMAVGLMLALAVPVAVAQSGHELFQQALRKERTEGDCAQAIPMYEKLAREAKQDRELAAKALVRAGECHEKLGQDAARKAYQRVVSEFSDQGEQVAIARARLAALGPTPARAAGVITKKVFGRDSMGGPSPDGRYLSFVHWKFGNLAVHDLATGEYRDLTDEGYWGPKSQWAEYSVWSRDGKQIAYTWFINEFPELRVIEAKGGRPQVIYGGDSASAWGGIRPLDWTSDGKAVLAARRGKQDGPQELVFVNVADHSVRPVIKLEERVMRASLSPDDRYIVLDVPETPGREARDILLVTSDGQRKEFVVRHSAVDYGPMWLPDGSGFVFNSNRGGSVGLWLQRMHDGKPTAEPELVKADMGRMFAMGFSRDGVLFYGYAGFNNAGDIYLGRLAAGGTKFAERPKMAVQQHVGANTSADISADGKLLAYLSRRGTLPIGSGSWSVVVRSLENGQERIVPVDLPEVLNPRQAPLRWSPDGRSLLVTGVDAGRRSGLFAVDVDSGQSRLLIEGAGGPRVNWPAWSREGDRIYYSRAVGTGENIFQHIESMDLNSGAVTQLGRGRTFAVSPDGRSVAIPFADKNGYGIRVVPTSGGEPREVLRQSRICNFYTGVAWTPDGQYILFGDTLGETPEGTPIRLARVPAEGGQPEYFGLEEQNLRDLTVSRDGNTLVYTAGSAHRAEVWTMENLGIAVRASR
jgi:Tol biopolymer transport system component